MKRKLSKQVKTDIWGWSMVSPLVAGMLIFTAYPLISSLVYSFFNYRGTGVLDTNKFVMFENYKNLFSYMGAGSFLHALKNTAIYTVISVPLGMVLGYLLATFLSANIKGSRTFLVLFYLPTLISSVVAGALWADMLNPEYGIINTILKNVFGLAEGIPFTDKSHLMPSYIFMTLFNLGGGSIIWVAGISSVDKAYYEAAKIDGAGKLKSFFKITLPLTTPYIFYNLIIGLIGSLQLFNQPFVLTKGDGGDGYALLTVEMLIYNSAFSGKMGAATAMAWILCIIIAVLTGLSFLFSGKWVHYSDD